MENEVFRKNGDQPVNDPSAEKMEETSKMAEAPEAEEMIIVESASEGGDTAATAESTMPAGSTETISEIKTETEFKNATEANVNAIPTITSFAEETFKSKSSEVPPVNTLRREKNSGKQSKRLAAMAGLCLASALIGGLTTVAAIPHIYPNAFSTAQTYTIPTAKTSAIPVSNVNNTSQSPVTEIAKTVGPAVVGVSNFQSTQSFFGRGFGNSFGNGFGNNFSNNSGAGLQEAGTGSGFIIDAQKGYIVTNNHVIDGAQKITVSLSDGRTVDAKVVGTDPRTDLAVLQISDTKNLTAVTLGDSTNLQVGQPVVAIGNPGGNEFARSVTTGVISATNRSLDIQGEDSFGLIQTDAAINPGNSGGPLVDYSGRVIGINSAKYAETGFEGMGFAIPISDALPTIQQLIQTGTAKHPALLVSVNDQYNAYALNNNLPQGAYIASVTAGGPADKAGITRGDVITKINDAPVQSSADLVRQLYKYNVGDKVNVTFIRNGQTHVVQVTLGEISSNQ